LGLITEVYKKTLLKKGRFFIHKSKGNKKRNKKRNGRKEPQGRKGDYEIQPTDTDFRRQYPLPDPCHLIPDYCRNY